MVVPTPLAPLASQRMREAVVLFCWWNATSWRTPTAFEVSADCHISLRISSPARLIAPLVFIVPVTTL